MAKRGFAQYDIPQDWNEEQDGYISVLFCVPNSPKWRGIATDLIQSLTFGRIWNEHSGNIKATQEIAERIFTSMAMCEIEEKLERIAVALEGINAKTSELVTWQEFLEDIETLTGTSNLIYQVTSTLLDLIPSLRFKPIPLTLIWNWFAETVTWRMPVMAQLTIMNTSLAATAATGLAGTFTSFWNTIFSGLGYINSWGANAKDIIFGDANLWDDVIYPVIARLVGTAPASETDQEPDERQSVINNNKIIIQSTINACCAGMPDFPAAAVPEYITSTPQSPLVSETVPPENYGEGWTYTPTGSGRCHLANALIRDTKEFFASLDEWLNIDDLGSYSLSYFMTGTMASIALLLSPVYIPTVALIALASGIMLAAAKATGEYVGQSILDAIDQEEACLLQMMAGASNVGDAQQQIKDHMGPLLGGVFTSVLMAWFNTSTLTQLFWYKDGHPYLGGLSTDNCDECAAAPDEYRWIAGSGNLDSDGLRILSSAPYVGASGAHRIYFQMDSPDPADYKYVNVHSRTGSVAGAQMLIITNEGGGSFTTNTYNVTRKCQGIIMYEELVGGVAFEASVTIKDTPF